MKVILYTTHCPMCSVLETKLKQKNIEYEEITDVELMENMNIDRVPVLSVDGNLMQMGEANKWINEWEVTE